MTRTIKPTPEQRKARKHRHQKQQLKDKDYIAERRDDTMQGYVKKWTDRGYGFICDQTGQDYFVHYTAILINGFKKLEQGQEVEFDIGSGTKGPQAINVQIRK